eukprot:755523-Hanusia_phi.AAC.1
MTRWQVRAIRVEEEDKKESNLQQKQGMGKRLSSGSLMLHEDVFVSQLHSRALLLNNSFQSKVVGILRQHAVQRGDTQKAFCSESKIVVDCQFHDGVFPVEFVPAAVKRKTRMAEKVMEYASEEHEEARWPFSRRILDPVGEVRASVVCDHPRHMAQVYSWLTSQETTGMRVCRVKNKLSLEEVPDGYRDIMVCLLFEGEDTVNIIGEVQIHDRMIYECKVKVRACVVGLWWRTVLTCCNTVAQTLPDKASREYREHHRSVYVKDKSMSCAEGAEILSFGPPCTLQKNENHVANSADGHSARR